jgi:hypothetical protein
MKIKLSIIVITIITFISQTVCSRDHERKITFTSTVDTIRNVSKFKIQGFYEDNTGLYCYFKPDGSDSVYLFKENEQGHFESDVVLKLPLAYSRIAPTDEIRQIVFINKDSLILFHQTNIALVSTVRDSLLQIFYHSSDSCPYVLLDRTNPYLQWNAHRKSLPLFIMDYRDYDKRKWLCETPFMAEYSLVKNDINIFPPVYVYQAYNDPYFVELHATIDPVFCFHGNTFVAAFALSPVMYRYDAQTNQLDSLEVINSSYLPLSYPDTNRMKAISKENYLQEQFLRHNYFLYLTYDPYNEVYYRFFTKEMKAQDDDGYYYTLADKEAGLTVINKNFEPVGDVILPQPHYNRYFVSSHGMYHIFYSTRVKDAIVYKLDLHYETDD